jgi:predicted RNA-binding Zn ribbon-like protein
MAVISTSWERQLVAGHPVLDFVNTLDNRFVSMGPDERLVTYKDLLEFLQASDLLSAQQSRTLRAFADTSAGQASLRRVRALREQLAVLFYRPPGEAPGAASLAALQVEFSRAKRHLLLRWERTGHSGGHAYWDWPSNPKSDWPLWILARQAELLIVTDEAAVRSCAQASCRWLFLDTSRNQSRRWCDMKLCGNRAKARRFHTRHSG